MLNSTKTLIIVFSIVSFALLMPCYVKADVVSAPNSIIAYDLNTDNRFLFGFDQETSEYYYCVKKKSIVFPWISYSAIYQGHNTQRRCILRSKESISSFFVHNGIIYYVTHASLGGRGNLTIYDIQSSRKEVLLPTSLGVGQILGIQNNLLFCETEKYICTVDLCSRTRQKLQNKDYYVTESTDYGITFFADGVWCFSTWQDGLSNNLFFSDTPPVNHLHTIAMDSIRYVTLDCAEDIATLVCNSSKILIRNALCASVDNNMAAILTSDGIIHIYSMSSRIDLLFELPITTTSNIYFCDNCIITMDNDGQLIVTELPNLP